MAEGEHVATAADLESGLEQAEGGGFGTDSGAGPGTEISPRVTEEYEGSVPARELEYESQHGYQHELEGTQSFRVEESVSRPCVQYPLNSKRLAAWHLRALAQALELPTTGSADQLRQCIEAVVGTDHEYQKVVVTVRESPKTEYGIALADADGEFLESEPVYRDTRRVRFDEELQNPAELYATRRKLEEANHLLELAAVRERESRRKQ